MARKKRDQGLSGTARENKEKAREQTDGSRGHRDAPDDAIDKMIRDNIKSRGA